MGRRSSLWNSSTFSDPSTIEELALPLQKKTFRSLSFSHGQTPGQGTGPNGAVNSSSSMEAPGSHMLDTFNEEESNASTPGVDTQLAEQMAATGLGSPNQSSSGHVRQANTMTSPQLGAPMSPPGFGQYSGFRQGHAQPQQQQYLPGPIGQGSLWFGPPGSRRHSYAGELMEQQRPNLRDRQSSQNTGQLDHQPQQQQQQQPQQPQPQQKQPQQQQQQPHQQQQQQRNHQQHHQQQSQQTQQTQSHGQNQTTQQGRSPDDIDTYFTQDSLGRNSLPTPPGSPKSTAIDELNGPPESIITIPSKKLYYVQFKAGRVDVFYIADSTSLVARQGDLVIVDADRGRDLGKVIKDHVTPRQAALLKLRRHQEQQAILQHSPPQGGHNAGATPGVTMPKQILRYAQPNEVRQIITKQQDEERAVQMCVQKVNEKGLDMKVLDAEYQWDRRKLTFFYSASHRIDFRDLVRDLFRIYKTRIWMCAVNTRRVSPPNSSVGSVPVSTPVAAPVTATPIAGPGPVPGPIPIGAGGPPPPPPGAVPPPGSMMEGVAPYGFMPQGPPPYREQRPNHQGYYYAFPPPAAAGSQQHYYYY